MDLLQALGAGPVVLDGGLATQLEAAGHDLSDELWSARLLADDPTAIVAAHRAFVDAGARVVTTASYQAGIDNLARRGLPAAELLRRSVELGRSAAGGTAWVAASIGPYGAVLADGSEYRGNYGLSHRQLVDFHGPRMELLAAAGPDVLALETIPDVREAEALLDCLDQLQVRAWLSYTVDGERTRAGQPLTDAFALAEHPSIVAIGVNCCSPEDATAAVPVAAATGKPVVVYPNSGETWDAVARRWRGTAHATNHVDEWIAAGARLIGGCCRVYPADIATIATKIPLTGQFSEFSRKTDRSV